MIARGSKTGQAMGLSPFETAAALIAGGQWPLGWPHFEGRHSIPVQSARTAIGFVREAAGLREGDEILISAYNCGTEVDALLAAGLKLRFVDCNEHGFVSLDILRASISPQTKGVYIIHPFGWPHPLAQIDRWRREQGLILIEDCALALFSGNADGSAVGTVGEVSVFSLTKSLPTPDGGILSWATGWTGPKELSAPPLGRTLHQLAVRTKAWMHHFMSRPALQAPAPQRVETLPAAVMEDMPQSYYFEAWREKRAPSMITRGYIERVIPADIKLQRQRNYRALASALNARNLAPLFADLPDHVCPLSCPIRTNRRDSMVASLKEYGIETSPWWSGGHRDVDWPRFPMACELKQTLLPLPVHQQLNAEDMARIADIAASLA